VGEHVLIGLEPQAFWRHFESITKIPRPPRHEERITAHVREWARGRTLEARADAAGNLVVSVPATPGRERVPTVVLQGHLDMVCEREPDSAYDAAEGRIGLVRDGDWLGADGTTLGADNGVAIAAMLALAEDESVPHGPLELLMTVAEEIGLEGANALDPLLVTGSILVNLDGEEDGTLTVGCSGSVDSWLRFELPREPLGDAPSLTVRVGGGKGGHSGINIADGRANALKLLGRILREAHRSTPFRLVSLDGGKARNAIPREASAVVAVEEDQVFRAAVDQAWATVRDAHAETDPGLSISVEPCESAADAWSDEHTARLLDVVALVPSGPLSMSTELGGGVETSTSLGVATTDGARLVLQSLTRTSNDAALPEVLGSFEALAGLAGGSLEVKPNYPGWRPNLDSPLLAVARKVHAATFGNEAVVSTMHAGLEPSVIAGRLSRPLDMIAVGPRIESPHSPDERLNIPSVDRFWKLLVALLDELSRPGAPPVSRPG
jgi:dipeptidase D